MLTLKQNYFPQHSFYILKKKVTAIVSFSFSNLCTEPRMTLSKKHVFNKPYWLTNGFTQETLKDT